MPDNVVRKRVTLHPLNEDGTIDLNTNLYPKTFLDGIVDREGNPVDLATQQELDEAIQEVKDAEVSPEELDEAIATVNERITNVATDLTTEINNVAEDVATKANEEDLEALAEEVAKKASTSYVDSAISALSSVYAPVGDYATNSALSSAISSINSTISSLDYASIGALSSATIIPNISGTNDGTNWLTITLNNSTYAIPQGMSSVNWGNINGNLSNQTDLQNALNNKANNSTVNTLSNTVSSLNTTVGNLNTTVTNISTAFVNKIKQVAVDWSSTSTYSKGRLVYYPVGAGTSPEMYRSLRDSNYNKNPSTQTTYWEKVTLSQLLLEATGASWGSITGDITAQTDLQTALANLQTAINNSAVAMLANLAPAWAAGTQYYVGDVVYYTDNKLYECLIEHQGSNTYKPDTATTYWKVTNIVASTIGLLNEEM